MGEILEILPKGQETLKAVESVEQVYSSRENNTMSAKKKDNVDFLCMPKVLY